MSGRKLTIRSIAKYLLLIMIAVSVVVVFDAPDAYAATTTVKLAHAAHGENGKTTGCKPGDQKGDEVCLRSWDYSSSSSSGLHWNVMVRCNDPAVAARIVKVAVAACKNDHIGYDKGSVKERQSFYKALVAANWDPSKITTDVETSCSPFVCACINAAYKSQYIKTDHSCTTLYKTLKADPHFTCYTAKEVCTTDKYLQPGDILITTGHHTAIVVEQKGKKVSIPATVTSTTTAASTSGATAAASTTAKTSTAGTAAATTTAASSSAAKSTNASAFKTGTTYTLTTNLNLRSGPGTNYSIIKYNAVASDLKKSALDQSGRAVLKSGTNVKSIEVKGDWIRISGGWICGKEGSSAYIKTAAASASKTSTNKKTATSAAAKKTAVKKTTAKKTVSVKIKAGRDYKLAKALYVRKGPGTKYAVKKRSALTTDAKKHARSGSKAVLKKGTIVTCLKKKGNWMRIPSGWIYCKAGNIVAA